MCMFFGILTLITALAIAGVAAWFSIAGLMAIFSAAALPIAVMAGTLEVGKLLTASWLYRYWNETTVLLKTYLCVAVAILMLITLNGPLYKGEDELVAGRIRAAMLLGLIGFVVALLV